MSAWQRLLERALGGVNNVLQAPLPPPLRSWLSSLFFWGLMSRSGFCSTVFALEAAGQLQPSLHCQLRFPQSSSPWYQFTPQCQLRADSLGRVCAFTHSRCTVLALPTYRDSQLHRAILNGQQSTQAFKARLPPPSFSPLFLAPSPSLFASSLFPHIPLNGCWRLGPVNLVLLKEI